MDTFQTPDFQQIRQEFPILQKAVHGKPLIYFDNAATTQKPLKVIESITEFYTSYNSNIHRGVHRLSQESTRLYEEARKKVQNFIHAASDKEIVFTAGATASINAIAYSFGEAMLTEGDEILLSQMEHHANIVPWQLVAQRKSCKIKIIPMNQDGELLLDQLQLLITEKTKIIAITQVSNSLGTINPVREVIRIAHDHGVPVLVDGSQAIQHQLVDVRDLDCDFYAFSGHKIYAPTGIGVLYGKEKWLEKLPPYQGGGDMIDHVSFEKTTFNQLPFKFEAGTMNYVGAHALGVALDFLSSIGMESIMAREAQLLSYATEKIKQFPGLRIIGNAREKAAVLSFILNDIHQFDIGMVLDKMGIAVRTGTHCNEPVMTFFGIEGTVRASFAFYNTEDEIDRLMDGIEKINLMFG